MASRRRPGLSGRPTSRMSDVLPKVVTSCDIGTSSTLPRGKSPTVQWMGEFCTLGVADGRSDRWKSAHPSALPSAGRPPSRWRSRPPGGRLFFLHGRPLAVRSAVDVANRLADGCFSRAAVRQSNRTLDGGGRSYGHPQLQPPSGLRCRPP